MASAEAILRTCRWYDRQQGVGPGLLAKWIRQGGVSESEAQEPERLPGVQERKRAELLAAFAEKARVFVPGSVTEPHKQAQTRSSRRQLDEIELCPGELVVIAASCDGLIVRCDRCGEEWSYSPRSAVATLPAAPIAVGRDEPPRPRMRPAGDRDERVALWRAVDRKTNLRRIGVEDMLQRWHNRERERPGERPILVEAPPSERSLA